jgi:hypothetical protein
LLAALAAAFVALTLVAPIPVSAHPTSADPTSVASAGTPAAATPDTTPDTTVPTTLEEQPPLQERPPVTASDFLPDDANLSDCIGLVERPGCGSEARGGIGQTAVFVALVAGLGLIFWRITAGVRRNRAAIDAARRSSDRGEQPADPGA